MKLDIISLLLIVIFINGNAQEDGAELITDRPDQTESSAVVPLKSLQIETGFIIENKETNIFKSRAFTYNSTLLRYGLVENMELRLGLEYLGEKVKNKNTDNVDTALGLSPLY